MRSLHLPSLKKYLTTLLWQKACNETIQLNQITVKLRHREFHAACNFIAIDQQV